MLALSLVVLFSTDNMWLQLLNAVFMAFVFGQTGFLAHDFGHRQGFQKTKYNNFFGLLHANLLIGMSYNWWMFKHNQHHSHPNEIDFDPDIDMPIIAFSPHDVLDRRGIARFFVKYQGYFFFFLLLFESYSLRSNSIVYLWQNRKQRHLYMGGLLMLLHAVWFFALIFMALGVWHGLLFVIIQQAFFGLYMGSVFAPNHKGMLIVDPKNPLGFLEMQVLTARNVKASPFADFWYGGLNYQIEHHLFPTMARNQLKEAQPIIRSFCEQHNISYYETSIVQSYREILGYLHEISAPLRERVPA
jgi:fatty acid desaturase